MRTTLALLLLVGCNPRVADITTTPASASTGSTSSITGTTSTTGTTGTRGTVQPFRVIEGPGTEVTDPLFWCVVGALQPGELVVSGTVGSLGIAQDTGATAIDIWQALEVVSRGDEVGYSGNCRGDTARILVTTL